jgi:tetratricopeptide (TPR) repeat protein
MSDDSQGYDIATVRRLLLKSFSPEELIAFCTDRPALREVVAEFGPGMGLNEMVAKVLGYCSRRRVWDELMAGVRHEREAVYAEFERELYMPGASPSITTAPVISTPFNLPSDLPDFAGREAEVAELRHLLDKGGLVIITGMGGIGKMTLAVHVARGLAAEGRFKDAQLFINLKGTDPQPLEPAAALRALLAAVAGPDPRRPADAEALAGLWRATMQNKDAVLLLATAVNAAQVRLLSPGGPSYAVMVTSRQRFTLPGAELIDLERLPAEEARTLLQTLAPRLDDAGADEITRLCGGLPLALRIAGNYLALNDDCSVGEYAERLADVSRLRDPDDPHLDVMAEITLSVNQLSEEARRAWALLGLFPAPFDAAAAAALWGTEEVAALDQLRGLRNRSLVSYDGKANRYDQQNLLRLAARREMEALSLAEAGKEAFIARERLARHYLGVARVAVEAQRYPALDADWPHLRVALEYAAGRNVGLLSDLVYALNGYWSVRAMARDRATWCQRAAEACAAAGRRRDEGNHLGDLGNAYADLGEAQRTIGYYQQALTIHREVGDQQGEGADLGSLGLAYAALGEPQRAIDYYEQALAIDRKVENRQGEGNHLGGLGLAYADLGEAQQAISYCEQALTITKEIHDRRGEGNDLCTLGNAYTKLREVQRAISYYERALAIHREIGDRRGEGTDLGKLGLSYKELGEMAHAREVWAEALRIFEEIEAPQAEWVRGLLAEHDTDSNG